MLIGLARWEPLRLPSPLCGSAWRTPASRAAAGKSRAFTGPRVDRPSPVGPAFSERGVPRGFFISRPLGEAEELLSRPLYTGPSSRRRKKLNFSHGKEGRFCCETHTFGPERLGAISVTLRLSHLLAFIRASIHYL